MAVQSQSSLTDVSDEHDVQMILLHVVLWALADLLLAGDGDRRLAALRRARVQRLIILVRPAVITAALVLRHLLLPVVCRMPQ